MQLFIIRHGKTDWNFQKRIQGQTDIPLNEEGIKQAKQAKEILHHENIHIIFSSPLTRAKQTADIINEDAKVPIRYDKRIIERNFGKFEGITKQDISNEEIEDLWRYNKPKQYLQAESVQDFYSRIFDFMEEIRKNYTDKNVLLVIHRAVAIAVNAYCEGTLPEDIDIHKRKT